MEPNKITRLQSAKYKTHVIKEELFNKMNQSHGLSYDETLLLRFQEVPNIKTACSYSKEGDLCWLEDSPLT